MKQQQIEKLNLMIEEKFKDKDIIILTCYRQDKKCSLIKTVLTGQLKSS